MASTPAELEVRGHRNDPLPHAYMRQEGEPRGLGLILPGMGYGLTKPGLHYPALLLDELGFDTLGLETRYNTPAFKNLPDDEALAWLRDDAAGAFRAAAGVRPYERMCVVAKSLGTIGLHLLLEQGELPGGAQLLWLTPLLEREEIRHSIAQQAQNSLVVIGTADPHYRAEWLEDLSQAGARVLVLESADHGLYVKGDVVATLGGMHTFLDEFKAFLQGSLPSIPAPLPG